MNIFVALEDLLLVRHQIYPEHVRTADTASGENIRRFDDSADRPRPDRHSFSAMPIDIGVHLFGD